jgi:DMSO/TMAO reductase YedYZ molybdopterin-dependent catalytic subunit
VSWTRVFRRAGRRTNVALLVVCVGAFLSGWVGFAVGTPAPATLATVAHGLFGLGVVALVPWKSVIVHRASAVPWTGWGLIVLILLCLAAGFVQFFVGFHVWSGLSPIQVHVGAALVAIPLFVWHIARRRRQRLRSADLSRRALLRTGVFALGIGAGYPAVAALAGWTRGPAGRVPTGSGRLEPEAIPATIWLLDRVPQVDVAAHRVDVAGRSLSAADLEAAAEPVRARLDCTSGWYAEATWTGVRLSELIPAGLLAKAASIQVRSLTGYTRRFPVTEAGSLWLATRVEGLALSAATGSPVRLVAPHRRGFWWVKWVASVQISDRPAWLQLPFPSQ